MSVNPEKLSLLSSIHELMVTDHSWQTDQAEQQKLWDYLCDIPELFHPKNSYCCEVDVFISVVTGPTLCSPFSTCPVIGGPESHKTRPYLTQDGWKQVLPFNFPNHAFKNWVVISLKILESGHFVVSSKKSNF